MKSVELLNKLLQKLPQTQLEEIWERVEAMDLQGQCEQQEEGRRMKEITELVNEYYDWLKTRTRLIEDEHSGWTTIGTPFTGIFNDGIEIYCKKQGDGWLLSDGGETIRHLENLGVSVVKNKTKIGRILMTRGAHLTFGDEIVLESTTTDFVKKLHSLIEILVGLENGLV